MSKWLQVFTLSYPTHNGSGPKILVLFNDYSRFNKEEDTGNNSYDDDDDEQEQTQ
jgi:hypothetical protein